MGSRRDQLSFLLDRRLRVMDLVIETLQGTAFELTVSPFDTVQDVKARISKVEGIPVSQQHLIWNSQELSDDSSLQDYNIQDGATIKLLPNMRVGPINTRRVAVEDSYIRDYTECLNRDEILERLQSSARPLTVIIYNNGDQINFYRVVDRTSASPSLSNGSGCLEGADDDEDAREAADEGQERTREKVKELRAKMENLHMEKKKRGGGNFVPSPPHLPHAPTAERPPSYQRRSLLRRSRDSATAGSSKTDPIKLDPLDPETLQAELPRSNHELTKTDLFRPNIEPMRAGFSRATNESFKNELIHSPIDLRASNQVDILASSAGDAARNSSGSERKSTGDERRLRTADMRLDERTEASYSRRMERRKDMDDFMRRSALPPVEDRRRLDASALSNDPLEAILNRARVKVACSGDHDVLNQTRDTMQPSRTGSRARSSFLKDSDSHVLRLSGRHHLPPMTRHQGKKKSKRCGLCNKKTGLANSFPCRCGVNFCSIHRYAEIHGCTFDYKSEGRRLLEQNNPVVTAPKLPKI